MKPVFVGGIFMAAVAVLLWVGVTSASIPDVQLRQLLSSGMTERVHVKDGQLAEIKSLQPLEFVVCGRDDPLARVLVRTERTIPENFKQGIDMGLEGHYDPGAKVFTAEIITTKCPSRYEASESTDSAPPYGAAAGVGTTDPFAKPEPYGQKGPYGQNESSTASPTAPVPGAGGVE